MYRISRSIAKEWPCLAGLLSISVGERDGINISHNLYPDPKSKAEKTLSLYNSRNTFSRNELATYLKEIRLHDLSDKVKLGSLRAL